MSGSCLPGTSPTCFIAIKGADLSGAAGNVVAAASMEQESNTSNGWIAELPRMVRPTRVNPVV